jgi:amidase/aspartyl-tRNA(Asn)/glutamyl-tRNA(Gln) amidotransferase subunit A
VSSHLIEGFGNAYRAGTLTPSDAIASQLAYARRLSEEINAISALSPTAEAEAEESTRRFERGRPIGPLDGVPVVVKDSYCVEGMPRWHGSAIHDGDPVSDHSSEPILRLREAGAVVVAKTTMPDMGMLASGISSQFGIVRNPWDKTRSPGGSSSGTAASLAAGLAAFGLGTDIAGSVRLPACHCGLVGIKPTQGRIAYSPGSVMRSSGVLATSVADASAALEVVGTQASTDPLCLPGSFEPTTYEEVVRRRPSVGLLLDMGYGEGPEPAVESAVRLAASRLEQGGLAVEEFRLNLSDADFDNADRVFKAHAIAEIRASRHPEAVLGLVGSWVAGSEALRMADYEDAMNGLLATVAKIERATRGYDFLVCPTLPTTGFAADVPGPGDEEQLLHHTQFTAWFNQTGQPAVSYRESDDAASGLPIGVQVVGRRFDDAGALAVAGYLEGTRGPVAEYPCFEGRPSYES